MDAEINETSVEYPVLKGYFLSKPGVGHYIAMHASPTARDFFLANFYPLGPFTYVLFFFVQKRPRIFPVLALANSGFSVGPQNKIGHPAHHRQLMQVPVLSARGI